jgi:uncharacterized protein
MMVGTILNAVGILVGGIVGMVRRKPLIPSTEAFFKVTLGAFTVFYGLRLTWLSLNGSLFQSLKQLLIAVLALMLGKLVGQLLRLQKMSNYLGCAARAHIAAATPSDPLRAGKGFKTCSALFCAAPLGLLGAVQLGLTQDYAYPLGIKAVMDGLAMIGLVRLFGSGAMLSALPVLALQGGVSEGCSRFLKPVLESHDLLNALNAVGGLLVFSVALVILGLKKIELADYLPSLVFAPLIAWLWR